MMNPIARVSIGMMLFLGSLTVTSPITAGDCCQRCGRECECRSVCHCVPFEKKVEVVCWGCTEADFCVPGPSIRGCDHCEDVCGDGNCCCRNRRLLWSDWTPCYAKTFTKRKLMKKVVVRKIPSHKWVTENLCDACAADCAQPTPEGKAAPAGKPTPAEPPAKPVLPRLTSAEAD